MKKQLIAVLVSSLMGGEALSVAHASPAPVVTISTAEAIAQFTYSPREFLNQYTVDVIELIKNGGLPTQGQVRLETAPQGFKLRYADAPAADTTSSYFLGFNGRTNPIPAYVDVPKHVAEGTLLLTGSLTGCSVIVTDLNDTHYRVFHDGRVGSSVLYDNVVMAVDYADYQGQGVSDEVAGAYMIFKDGQWQLMLQRQEQIPHPDNPLLTTWVKRKGATGEVRIQRPNAIDDQARVEAFRQERTLAQGRLLTDAKALGLSVEPLPQDQDYQTGSSLKVDENPALAQWQDLRNALKQKTDEELAPLLERKSVLFAKLRKATGERKQHLQAQIDAINATKAFYQQSYLDGIDKSIDMDRLWLWLEKKDREGVSSVIAIDAHLKASPNQRLVDQYNTQKQALESLKGQRGDDYLFGKSNSQDIEVPGYHQGMKALDMIRLMFDDSHQLTFKQKGALVAHIKQQFQQETMRFALDKSAEVSRYMTAQGAFVTQLVPQDFVLLGRPGRCLPLSRVMATAIAQKGEPGANQFASVLFDAAAHPDSQIATNVYTTVGQLHSNTDAGLAETDAGRLSIKGIVSNLEKESLTNGSSKFMLMNTHAHSMLVGKRQFEGKSRYFFYDPNFAVFRFDSSKALQASLKEHLIKNKFARFYDAYGSVSQPTFDMRSLDTAKMAEVRLSTGLSVQDLASPSDRVANLATADHAARLAQASDSLSTDLQLKSALGVLQGANLAQDFFAAAQDVYRRHRLDHAWVPVFENIEKTPSGQYRIPLIHREDNREISVLTSDERIWKFKHYYEDALGRLKKSYNFSHGELTRHASITDVEHVDGLNAAFAVQAILSWFNNHSRTAAAGDPLPQGLNTALQVHTYINLAQIAHGTVMDASKIVGLYRAALQEGQSVTSSTLSAVGHVANEGIGLGLGFASVVLDSYELAHAQNEVQKAVFGTQLAFDSASFVTTSAGIGAGLAGAGTASAVLGGAGVILGGLAVGFTALAQAFGEVAEDAKAVGRYFAAVDSAYHSGGYALVDKTLDDGSRYHALEPKDGAVISQIDLQTGQVHFDSQYIYRTHHGSTGSGAINYFFWAGDFPRMIRDKSQAINVRAGIGYNETTNINASDRALILPATPKSYISYQYQILPGSTTRHDSGFSVIRRLEEDRRFDYDFYIFPSEYTIRKITQEYVHTNINVNLDAQNRQILMRKLGKELSGKLHYAFNGKGGEYHISLQSGASLSLQVTSRRDRSTRWILDARQLSSDHLEVTRDHLNIGGVRVNLPGLSWGSIAVINKHNEVLVVDPENSRYQITSEDASSWQNAEQLHQHIQSEVAKHHLDSAFVAVENFVPQDQDHSVGLAYYQVNQQRFIYTPSPAHSDFLSDAKLVAQTGDLAWFNKDNQVWLVNIAESRVVAQYRAFGWDYAHGKATSRVWQENQRLYWSIEQQTNAGHPAKWTYVLDENSMKLVDVNGDLQLLDNLMADTAPNRVTTNYFFQSFQAGVGGEIDLRADRWIEASLSDVISVSANKQGQKHRYWVLAEQRGDLGVIHANLNNQPDDLILALVQNKGETDQHYFFYSHSQQRLYYQASNRSQARSVSLPEFSGGLRNVLDNQHQLFAIANDQTLWLADQTPRLAGVTSHWLQSHHQQVLPQLKALSEKAAAKLAQLVLLGMTDSQGETVNLWYDNQSATLIRAGSNLNGQHLNFLGLTADQQWAWLYNHDDASLYRQAVVNDDLILDDKLVLQGEVADAEQFATLAGELTHAAWQGQSLQLSTRDGLVVELSANAGPMDKPILRAVTMEWQTHHQYRHQAIDALESEYQLPKQVRLLGSVPSWYLHESGRTVTAPGLDVQHNLTYLGQSVDGGDYVFDVDAQTLYQQNLTDHSPLGHFSMALTEGGTHLVLQGSEGSKIQTLPRIKGVRSLLWSGNSRDYHYSLDENDLAHYQQVLIQSHRVGETLKLALENPNALLLQRRGDDLALYDPGSQTSILIQHVDTAALTNKMKLSTSLGEKYLYKILSQVDRLSATPSEIIPYGQLN
ncbi:TcdA/TcdB pore-forming domain-containing protein [Vibrio europaeus]|uniref:Cytotoxin Mcf n=1 Tax=Vibrio europaeus TaxID=300876 RepID=A0A178J4V2_9VIBR|nr:TcdA/TcdB pore-forming domain-containing protein [Vibrio europaeus]MDC5706720.1 cytotoxin Mcf [Vibrio europaeus]MDC5711745.1 cytotoxin Mcf [Vibrio europaeus]MDC5716289.1 cytotoxin Mcf [Vibrio europaeus]MDC5725860.1 cytotoxin Mcf [Vibrio europaeus]MDC5732849.1 cytotoxin Mcf [Vibrio europaeus]